LLVALLSACSTPDSRIDSNRAAFDQYPAAVQEKIRAGRVDVGFTPEMVRIALGEPKRTFNRKTETGEAEVWIYTDSKPAISFGIGYSSGGYRSGGTGVGVATSTGGREADEKARVEFRDGLVAAVEYSK
jgi:hypothetical protein